MTSWQPSALIRSRAPSRKESWALVFESAAFSKSDARFLFVVLCGFTFFYLLSSSFKIIKTSALECLVDILRLLVLDLIPSVSRLKEWRDPDFPNGRKVNFLPAIWFPIADLIKYSSSRAPGSSLSCSIMSEFNLELCSLLFLSYSCCWGFAWNRVTFSCV